MAPLAAVQGDRVQSSLLTLSSVILHKAKHTNQIQVTYEKEKNKLGKRKRGDGSKIKNI